MVELSWHLENQIIVCAFCFLDTELGDLCNRLCLCVPLFNSVLSDAVHINIVFGENQLQILESR
jgi:hypothetical protein